MNKFTFLLWASIIVFAVVVIDYNYYPQHYIYAENNASEAWLYVVNDGWRSQPFIVEKGTSPYFIQDFINGREVLYKMPLKEAPLTVHLVNYALMFVAFVLLAFVVYQFVKIVKEKKKFRIS